MILDTGKEVQLGETIFKFASTGIAKAFETCLNTSPLSTCTADWPPVAIYPPPMLDIDLD